MAELIWAPTALKDIDEIAGYISNDSLPAAENMVQLFFERAEFLIDHLHFGKPVPELENKKIREIPVSRYRIIYELVSKNKIHILSVHHQSRLLKNNPVFKRRIQRK